ncbi:hepatic lectin-like [Mixophyes fleayi]|uniref:hepatic lectin-like n=1 Tax=Mixophyes fleayi TaxID=3061075 RepID=UPI003F4E3B8F
MQSFSQNGRSIYSITSQSTSSSSTGAVSGSIYSIKSQSTSSSSTGAVSGNLHVVQTPMSWSQSRTHCRSYFTDLAVLSSLDEQGMMATLLSDYTPSKGFWFGLRRSRLWGHWYWSGGQTWGTFSFWGDGEPNSPLSKQCGLISGDPARNFSWSSGCCAQQLPFVCYGG